MQSLSWKNLSPKSLGFTDGSDYFKGNIDTGVLGGWLTDTDKELQHAMVYLKAIANKYGREALYNLLMNGDDDDVIPDDINVKGIRAMLGDNAVDDIMSDIDNPDLWKQVDVNNDGDTDLQIADTNGDDKPDTAIITADSKAEEKEAVKTAKEKLGLDKEDTTSTGKTKGELSDSETLSDFRKKRIAKMSSSWGKTDTQKEIEKAQGHNSSCTCSLCKKYHLNGYGANGVATNTDARQKNILSALIDRRF